MPTCPGPSRVCLPRDTRKLATDHSRVHVKTTLSRTRTERPLGTRNRNANAVNGDTVPFDPGVPRHLGSNDTGVQRRPTRLYG